MLPSTSKHRNARRHDSRAGRSHWIYTTGDVLDLYKIAPNTLTAWKRLGLPSVHGTCDLYLGQDLNDFHRWFKKRRSRPLASTEVFCVHCNEAHSLYDNLYRLGQNKTGCDCVILLCPVSGKDAYKIVSHAKIALIQQDIDRNFRGEADDYSVARVGSETAIFSPSVSTTSNVKNLERRLAYQQYLKQAKGLNEKTVISILRHIDQFDNFTMNQDHAAIQRDTVISYKIQFEAKLSAPDRERRVHSTLVHALNNLKRFFNWLEKSAGTKLAARGIGDYFSPTRAMCAIAAAATDGLPPPSLEQVRSLILAMPSENFIQRRNRALMAFLFLSGVRISALLTLQFQHIDLGARSVFQDARIVDTKNKKTMRTSWFPVGEEIEAIFIGWVEECLENGAGKTDPLFPKAVDPIRGWQHAKPLTDQGMVRKIIKQACAEVELTYFSPHAIRDTLALFGKEVCRTPMQEKAWSQNLGHDHVATTDKYYAKLDTATQHTVMNELRTTFARSEVQELLQMLPELSPKNLAIVFDVAKGLARQNSSA